MTDPEDLKHVERELEARATREAQLRYALELGLAHSAPDVASGAIFGALATLASDVLDLKALEMVDMGMQALLHRLPEHREASHRWHALRDGFDPDQDAIAIVDLARRVEHTAHRFRLSGTQVPTGAAAIEEFRAEYLVPRFGETSLTGEALEQLFAKLDRRRSSGGLTIAGVVARIIHDGRLLGARDDLSKTLRRVDRVLARLANPVK